MVGPIARRIRLRDQRERRMTTTAPERAAIVENPEVIASAPDRPRVFVRRWSGPGLAVAGLFFALSLFPSLLPRPGWVQGVVSGVTLMVGYGLGAGGAALWRYLGIPNPSGRLGTAVKWVVGGLVVVAVGSSVWQHVGWQNNGRDLLGMEPTTASLWPTVAVVTILVAGLLLVVSRSLRLLFHSVIGRLALRLPPRLASVLGVTALAIVIWLLVSGLLVNGAFALARQGFAPRDSATSASVVQPTSPKRSGSPASEVSWDSLGRQGRSFVATGPTVAELTAATGPGALEPIRVYAGLKSADTIQGRADLVLRELRRTGAFQRTVLVIATTTGTGFLDPAAVDPLEYLHRGSTAIAGVQYSYLPSWISLLADQEAVQETSLTVFRTVHAYWTTLDPTTRPKLYLYGLSLGSYGVESFLTSVDLVNAPIGGAFLSGPPFVNPLHAELETTRDPDSPPWRPIVGAGGTVRFTAQQPVLEDLPGRWGPTRIAYLQHGSDPIVFFNGNLTFHSPDWLQDGQRAPDVSDRFTWAPLVTMWQVALDLPSAGSVPWGYGHLYPASENVYAWAAVTRPSGWDAAQLNTLGTTLDQKLS